MAIVSLTDPTEISYLVGSDHVHHALVVSASFEPRCAGATTLLRRPMSDYEPSYVALIEYGFEGDRSVERSSRLNGQVLLRELESLGGVGSLARLRLEPHETANASASFAAWMNLLPPGTCLTVDITTLTKLHVMLLLEEASRHEHVNQVVLLYTRGSYGRYDPLSWGAKEAYVVPGFGRAKDPDGTAALLLFCGLEPNRSYSIVKEFSAVRRGELVFVSPGSESLDDVVQRSRKWHRFAFTRGYSERTIPALSPSAGLELLRAASSELAPNEHLLIAPLTTKWEAVATWLFFTEHPASNASVVYAAPGRYNVDAYTKRVLGGVFRADLQFHREPRAT